MTGRKKRQRLCLFLPLLAFPSFPISFQLLLNAFFQHPHLDWAHQSHSQRMKRDRHPPRIKLTKKRLQLEEIVCSDTYWNNSSWAGMDFIHPVVTICYVTYAIVTDRGGPEGVTPFTVDLWADPTAKCEGSKGVVVCKENDCMDQLCQGPAVLFSLQKLL